MKASIAISKIRVSKNFMKAARLAYGSLDLVTPKPQMTLPGRPKATKTR